MEPVQSRTDFREETQVPCGSCKRLFVEQDRIVHSLERDLAAHQRDVRKLEEEAEKQRKNLASILEEKNVLKQELKNLQSNQIPKSASSKVLFGKQDASHGVKQVAKGSKTNQQLDMLQQQLVRLEKEKNHLNEQIKNFEKDTEELSNIFETQKEKYEQEFTNKDRVINVLEKERKLMEKDSKNLREELEKTRKNNEDTKNLVKQLKLSTQEKDAAIVNLSNLHNEALKQANKVQKELIFSEECLKNELSGRKILEEKFENESTEKTLLGDKNQLLQIQVDSLRATESQLQEELQHLEELVKKLEKENNEKEKDIGELKTGNTKLKQDKENTVKALEEAKTNVEVLCLRLEDLTNENCLVSNEKNAVDVKLKTLQSDINSMVEQRAKQGKEILNTRMCLDDIEQKLEIKIVESEELEEKVLRMKRAVEELKIKEDRLKKCLEAAEYERNSIISVKQTLELDFEKSKDTNQGLKETVCKFSQENDNLQAICETKTKENEDLEKAVNQKVLIITSLKRQEQKLQNDIEELLSDEARYEVQLKNCQDENARLLREKTKIEGNYEKINLHLQECLCLLDEKREEYIAVKKTLEEQVEKQTEEASRFREQSVEINKDLRNREDEISSLIMEKQELLRNFEDLENRMEESLSVRSRLEDEVNLLKHRVEECEENERQESEKLMKTKSRYEEAKQNLENEKEEKSDIASSLTNAVENVERWKKISLEIKEERNRLQMQIEELDRDLNEKHLHFTEEKSSLEKNMESLRNVISRLKSNEERLREKIEELRDDVDKLLHVKSEQQSQIRKLVHEKERMANTVVDYSKLVDENTKLKNESLEIGKEYAALEKEVLLWQEKAGMTEEENERLAKEFQECQNELGTFRENFKETSQECKDLRNESSVLRDCNAEIVDEKQRLVNENSRLKEKKCSIVQERNKLQDMIESLDKCHSEKNENLTRKKALLVKELALMRQTLKNCEEKERGLLNDIQKLNKNLEKAMSENEDLQSSLKKSCNENNRLRMRVAELGKDVEKIEAERDAKICLEIELQEKEQGIKKLKEKEKVLNTLVGSLNQQQNQHKNESRHKERELNELKVKLETERKDKEKFKDVIRRLDEEVRKVKTRELSCIEELENVKDNNSQLASVILRQEKERDECKELLERNIAKHKKRIEEMDNERSQVLDRVKKLENENSKARLNNDDLNLQIQNRQEEIQLITENMIKIEGRLKKADEEIIDLTDESAGLQTENQSLREHGENLEKVFASKSSAMSDQTSGMEKEIKVLRDTLVQLRGTGESNRKEIDELKRKLEKEKNEKINAEMKVNEMKLKRERLGERNDELLKNCERLEILANKGLQQKLEKEEKEKLLEAEKQKNRVVEEELEKKIQQLSKTNNEHENFKEEISNYKQSLAKLKTSKEELLASNKELAQKNEQTLQESHFINEKFKQVCSEKQQLSEQLSSHEEEVDSLKKEVKETKTELQLKIQESESDKWQLQTDLKSKEEALARMIEKHQKLQEDFRKMKEESDDIENENEDILAEFEKSKEANKKAKCALLSLQTENHDLQKELREKLNTLNESTEKFALEKFEMESEISSLKKKVVQGQERTEKQRELEKMLRLEIEELSDAYVKLEEEIHQCNKDNVFLKEKVKELTQSVEELDLARETACLLKEKRHCELLKSEKNLQRLEKNLKEKQKTNKKMMKELDSILEKQKVLELQLSSEKEVSVLRLNQLQDLQSGQRKLDEELWKMKHDREKLEAESETWRLNNNSMKVRIEMLEEELKSMAGEKEKSEQLYEESKIENRVNEEKSQRILTGLSQQKVLLEERIREATEEKNRLQNKLKHLDWKLDQQKIEIIGLNTSYEDMSDKYEASQMIVSVLQDDVKRKDERIIDLEERKNQMVNLLADLDSKIAEIQVQAVNLESENCNLMEEIDRMASSEERWRETVEQQSKLFTEKFETESKEKQQLHGIKEHFMQLHLNAETRVQEANIELTKLRVDQKQINAENASLIDSKKNLKNKLQETASAESRLKQNLSVMTNKITKLEFQISSLLEDLQRLKTEKVVSSNEQEETRYQLKDSEEKNRESEDRLGKQSADLENTQEILKNVHGKVKEQEENLANMIIKNKDILKMKDKTIESLTKENGNFQKTIDSLTAKLEQNQEENTKNEKENKRLKETVERKQELLNEAEVSHQHLVSTKDSLGLEQKKLFSKHKKVSKELAKLEFEHQRVLVEHKNFHCENEKRRKESNEQNNLLLEEKLTLEEELENERTKLGNVEMEKNILEDRNEDETNRLKETMFTLQDVQHKLNVQEQKNNHLGKDLQESIAERNYLDEANRKANKVLLKLKNKSVSSEMRNQEAQEILSDNYNGKNKDSADPFLVKKSESSTKTLQESLSLAALNSCELEKNVLEMEIDVRSLRNENAKMEKELSGLKTSLDSLLTEKNWLAIDLAKHVKKLENEFKLREKASENAIRIENDIECLKKEKDDITKDMQANNLDLSKRNAEIQEEMDFLKAHNIDITRHRDEAGKEINQMKEKLRMFQDKIEERESAIYSFKEELFCVEDENEKLKDMNEENKELIQKLQVLKDVQSSEIKNLQKRLGENLQQLERLESGFHIKNEGRKDTALIQRTVVKGVFKLEGEETKNERSASYLKQRFDKIHEKNRFQLKKTEKLQEDLDDAQKKLTTCLEKLSESEATRNMLDDKCLELQKQLSTAQCQHEEALSKLNELAKNLNMAKLNLEESNASHDEENLRISQELTHMQAELASACEKFNKSISKANSLEEKIQEMKNCILELENSLKCCRGNERRLQVRTAELETKTEILLEANDELSKAKEEVDKKDEALKCKFRKEKEINEKEFVEQEATIQQLNLKLEGAQRREKRIKELLTKAEGTIINLNEEHQSAESQFKEKDLSTKTEIQECKSNILQLHQEILQLKEHVRQLEENRNELTKTNESLQNRISDANNDIQEYELILKEGSKEKEIVRQNLEEVFTAVFNEDEAESHDFNDQMSKLKGVAKIHLELKKIEDQLKNESQCLQNELSKFQEDNKHLHDKFKKKSQDYEKLYVHNTKLKKYLQKLEMELDEAEVKTTLVENKQSRVLEELEAMKEQEMQQQYQHKVLEKEKESLENEIAWTEEKTETLFKTLEHSFHNLSEFNRNVKNRTPDDSGIDVESQVDMSFKQGRLDSGIFSPELDSSMVFPPAMSEKADKTFRPDNIRTLESAVKKSVQILSVFDKTIQDKTRLFTEKEKDLVKEVSTLKQTVNHNKDIRSVLEDEVQRLDKSQKTFQETVKEKNEYLATCHVELGHLRTALDEKEKAMEMLNESVLEYKKRQEFLENKLAVKQKAAEQEEKEKSHIKRTIKEYQKICEELRKNCLQTESPSQTNLDTKLGKSESLVTQDGNINSQLRNICATLRNMVDRLNTQLHKSDARATALDQELRELKEENNETEEQMTSLSQDLNNSKAIRMDLEEMGKEMREACNEAVRQQTVLNTKLEKAGKEGKNMKDEIAQLKLENTSLTEKLKVEKQALDEKRCENMQFSMEINKKEELLTNSKAKLETIRAFLEKINKCKDELESEIDQAQRENGELKVVNASLRKDNTSMSEDTTRKESEIEEKDYAIDQLEQMNNKLAKDLNANRLAFTETENEFIKSLSQVEKIKDTIQATHRLLQFYPSVCTKDNFELKLKAQDPKQEKKKDLASLSEQLLEISFTTDIVSQICQKIAIERQDLLGEVSQQSLLVENVQQENARLEDRKKQLIHIVTTLSKKYSDLESLSTHQEEVLTNVKDQLFLEKKAAVELLNVNSSFKEKTRQLENELSSFSKQAEELKNDRSGLKKELLESQNELSLLKCKCERLDSLTEELESTKRTMSELKDIYNKTLMDKDDARLEVEYAQKKLKDLENIQIKEKRLLDETQRALEQERDRITMVTKVARMKEKDLDNAKIDLKVNEDLIQQMQKQTNELKELTEKVQKELLNAKKELAMVQEKEKVLSNEKVCLWKTNSILETRLEELEIAKQALGEEIKKKKSKTSILVESYDKQKKSNDQLAKELKLLMQESDENNIKRQELESEKAKIQEEMENMKEKLQLKNQELLERCFASEAKYTDLENSLFRLNNEFNKLESRKDELGNALSQKESKFEELKEQNMELQARIKLQGESMDDQKNRVVHLISENNDLKQSLELSSSENEQLKSNNERVEQHLKVSKTNLAQKEQENYLFQREISVEKETIHTLKRTVAKSRKAIKDLQDNIVEKDTILQSTNRDLEHKTRIISELEGDKKNLDDLYHLSQDSETGLRKDLEDSNFLADNLKSENIGLTKANNDLKDEIAEKRSTIDDLKAKLGTITQEKDEINNKLLEARREIDDGINGCRTEISDIRMKICLMQNELSADHLPIENRAKGKTVYNKATAVRNELQEVKASLDQTHSSLKHLVEVERKMKKDLEETVSKNQTALYEHKNRQENNVKHLEASLDKVQAEYSKLEAQQTNLEKSHHKLKEKRVLLERKVVQLEESILEEQRKVKDITEELSRSIKDKNSLCNEVQILEASLCDVMKENDEHSSKQKQLAMLREELIGKLNNLEDTNRTFSEEITELVEKLSLSQEQVTALQSDLDASVEISELLEKRFVEESENNTILRLKVEAHHNQVVLLDNSLKSAVSQVEEMDKRIVSLNEDVRLMELATELKDDEISRLRKEQIRIQDELKDSILQVKCYKKLQEDTLKSQKEAETKLHKTAVLIENSENLLSQEKKITQHFKTENNSLKLELETAANDLQDKTGDFMSQLSVAKAKVEALNEELESTTEMVGELENELIVQRTKIKDIEEKRRAILEELSDLKINYSCVRVKLDQRLKENRKLQEDKRKLKEQVNEMDERLQKECQESARKIECQKQEVENLRIQMADSTRANQNLQNEFVEMQEKSDVLRKRNNEKQKEFESVLEEKNKDLKHLKKSCNRKDEIISQVSKRLTTAECKAEELQKNLLLVSNNFEAVKSELDNLEQTHKKIVHETFLLQGMVIENWKLNESEHAKDVNLDVENSRDTLIDPSKTIKFLCSSLKQLKNYTDDLQRRTLELEEELTKSKETASSEKLHSKEIHERLKQEIQNLQLHCEALEKSSEETQKIFSARNVEDELMQTEMKELKEREAKLDKKIEEKEDQCLTLVNEMEVAERKRVSLENEKKHMEGERDSVIKEAIAARETNNELKEQNSSLLGEILCLKNRAKTIETSLSGYVNRNKDLRERLADAEIELLVLGKTKQDAANEIASAKKKLEEMQKEKIVHEEELKEIKRKNVDLGVEVGKLNNLNTQAMDENAELKLTRTQLKEEKEKLESNVSSLRDQLDRMENDQNEKTTTKSRLQNQLDETFTSLERQQAKLSQALNDQDVLHNQLREAEHELKVVMGDNALLNQQLFRNHKNMFSNPNADELSKSRIRLSELKRKELALAQENRFLLDKLRAKSEELRDSKLKEEDSKREVELNREKMRRFLDERDRWEGEMKCVIHQIENGTKKNVFPGNVHNVSRKTNTF